MKVTIGPYKNWVGPYQIAEWVPFLNADQQHALGYWLVNNTPLMSICTWVESKRKRKIKVRIDRYDTWSMDDTLAHIILPMLKQLRDTKHGSPMVDDEDVPPHMRYSGDNWVHYKWEWVLNEMIFAFENIVDDSWEDKFYHGEPSYIYVPVNPKEEYTSVSSDLEDAMESDWVRMEQTNPDYWVDYEGIKQYNDRINNGCRLFGKYYRGLWD